MDEAMALAPEGYGDDGGVVMLPEVAEVGWCRICGDVAPLTKEHIPPRVVGNKGQHRTFSLAGSVNRPEGTLDLGPGTPGQGGIWGYTLCKECNELTGQRYVREFRDWVGRAASILAAGPAPGEVDAQVEPLGMAFGLGGAEDGGVAPGDFVRQVLAMMSTLSGSWRLNERHPIVREIILHGVPAPLPDDLRLSMTLTWGPHVRLIGPQFFLDADTGEWAWTMELTYPPISVLMVLASNHEIRMPGVEITRFSEVPPRQAGFSFETEGAVQVGFTWTPFPWDFRSSAAIEAQRAGPPAAASN